MIFSSNDLRRKETFDSVRMPFGADVLDSVRIEQFRDGYLPYRASEVKDVFEELKHEHAPDLIFTHYRQDFHQDHRLIGEPT